MALWKQDTALHPTFLPINGCLAEDWFLLPFELRLQHAHAAALEAAGIFTATERAALTEALRLIEREFGGAACPASDAEDIHTWLEGKLTDYAGDAGRKIHTARSRNDQVATLLRLYAIDRGERLVAQLTRLIRVLAEKAVTWADHVMPMQTHTQFAAPGSAGFWALRYAVAFERLRHRGRYLTGQWRQTCPLGSGAVAGSSIPIDRRVQAAQLGFAEPSLNALDSTSTRDECLEFLMLATQLGLHYQSFATDVILFAQTPLMWADYPRPFATGSSMMPNKLNPDAMELLRGESGEFFGGVAQLITTLKGLPSGYNRDLQCVKPVLWRGAEKAQLLTEMLIAFCEQLEFHPERLRAALSRGHVDATLRMEQRVRDGLPLRAAHHATAEELKSLPDEIPPAQQLDGTRYQTLGSAAPVEVRRAAQALLASL